MVRDYRNSFLRRKGRKDSWTSGRLLTVTFSSSRSVEKCFWEFAPKFEVYVHRRGSQMQRKTETRSEGTEGDVSKEKGVKKYIITIQWVWRHTGEIRSTARVRVLYTDMRLEVYVHLEKTCTTGEERRTTSSSHTLTRELYRRGSGRSEKQIRI